MSSSATHSGTTPAVGGSGRGLGIAAAVLALVIAVGVVVSVNQGNDGSATDVNAQVNSRAAQAETDRYNAMAEYAFQNDPENLPSELKRIYEMIAAAEARNYAGTNVERTKMANAGQLDLPATDSHPATNVERTKMANSGQLGFESAGSGVIGQQFAHEFSEDEGSPRNRNRLEGIAR